MRVSEITVDCKNMPMHTVKFVNKKLCVARLDFFFTYSKTDHFVSGTIIVMFKQKNKNVCPLFYLSFLFDPSSIYQCSALLKRSLPIEKMDLSPIHLEFTLQQHASKRVFTMIKLRKWDISSNKPLCVILVFKICLNIILCIYFMLICF